MGTLPLVLSNGEPGGGRTRDNLIKSQVLYQLSYRPFRLIFRKLIEPKNQCQPVFFIAPLFLKDISVF